MKFLAVAVFLVAVAYARAGAIGLPLAASRGALEGALGGKWIPDVPVANAPLATPLSATPWAAAPLTAASWTGAAVPAATWTGAPWAAASWSATPYLASPAAAAIAAPAAAVPGVAWGSPALSRGDLEGALGGQWIPDVSPEH